MEITLALNKMSVEEKIQVMESIWEDLCKTPNSFTSPDWHQRVLSNRSEQAKKGKDEFTDWETAKK